MTWTDLWFGMWHNTMSDFKYMMLRILYLIKMGLSSGAGEQDGSSKYVNYFIRA